MLSIHDETLCSPPRITRIERPHSDYINTVIYPEQDTDILDTTIELDLRAPEFYTPDPESQDEDKMDYHRKYWFRVLRADKAEPHIFIAISTDYKYMIVSSTEVKDNGPVYANNVVQYPVQNLEIIGLEVENYYSNRYDYNEGFVLSCASTESDNIIIVEYVDDDTVRFVLYNETISKIIKKEEEIHHIEDVVAYRKNKLEGKTIYAGN